MSGALAGLTMNGMVRLDMSEYMKTLCLTPIGALRQGYEEGGQLTEAVRKPYSVVLFDEIEKHIMMFNPCCNLDDGRLTDGKGGRWICTIIIMTSNIGPGDPCHQGKEEEYENMKESVLDLAPLFPPEF